MPATLSPPPPVDRTRRVDNRPQPLRGESQGAFVARCHKTLRGSTDEKTRYALEKWAASGREAQLERIARTRFASDKFRRVRNRPLFVEHAKARTITDPVTGQEREIVDRYDRRALEEIAHRCNERILDTGDFSPLIEGHTPDKDARDNGVPMPDVLGYAGPFRVGLIGNVKPRWAIFADEWHHVEDAPRLAKLQRRSPEVWLEEAMHDRFMDPIACLGAETPRLDMGLTQFCRTADGRLVEKYSSVAVEPSGASTFLPSDRGERRKVYAAQGDQPMLAPEDIKQIVDAIEQLDWVQGVKEMLAAGPGGADAGLPAPGAPEAPVGPEAPAPEVGPPDVGDTGAPPQPPPDQMAARYECDDEDKEMFARYMSGDAEDEEVQEYMAGKRARYGAAEGSAEEGDPGNPTDNGTVVNDSVAYSRSRNGSRVDHAAKYARLEREHRQVKDRLSKLEAEKRSVYRRSRLNEKLAVGFCFDIDDELDLTSGMTDQQFDTHVDRVVEKYERVPLSMHHPPLSTPDLPAERAKNDRYARERSDKISKYILREREKGNAITWEEAAEKIDAA